MLGLVIIMAWYFAAIGWLVARLADGNARRIGLFGSFAVGEPRPDRNEILEVVPVPVREWVRMCMEGEVDDMKSVAVTMRALPHLKRFLA